MSKLYEFFAAGIADQIAMAGEPATYQYRSATSSVNAVITEQSGDTALELGGMLYSVTGQALIADTAGIVPASGATLTTATGFKYLILSAIKSINEAAYSCTLHKLK